MIDHPCILLVWEQENTDILKTLPWLYQTETKKGIQYHYGGGYSVHDFAEKAWEVLNLLQSTNKFQSIDCRDFGNEIYNAVHHDDHLRVPKWTL